MNVTNYDFKTKWCNHLATEVLFREGARVNCLKDNACLHAEQCQNVHCQWWEGKGEDLLHPVENAYEM